VLTGRRIQFHMSRVLTVGQVVVLAQFPIVKVRVLAEVERQIRDMQAVVVNTSVEFGQVAVAVEEQVALVKTQARAVLIPEMGGLEFLLQ